MKKTLTTENLTILAILSGIGFGIFFPELALKQEIIGQVFLALLKMLIVPLIFASIFVAIVNLGSAEALKNIGSKAFLYYFSTTALAVFLGLVVVNILNPGVSLNITPKETAPEVAMFSIEHFILGFVPTNIIKS